MANLHTHCLFIHRDNVFNKTNNYSTHWIPFAIFPFRLTNIFMNTNFFLTNWQTPLNRQWKESTAQVFGGDFSSSWDSPLVLSKLDSRALDSRPELRALDPTRPLVLSVSRLVLSALGWQPMKNMLAFLMVGHLQRCLLLFWKLRKFLFEKGADADAKNMYTIYFQVVILSLYLLHGEGANTTLCKVLWKQKDQSVFYQSC